MRINEGGSRPFDSTTNWNDNSHVTAEIENILIWLMGPRTGPIISSGGFAWVPTRIGVPRPKPGSIRHTASCSVCNSLQLSTVLKTLSVGTWKDQRVFLKVQIRRGASLQTRPKAGLCRVQRVSSRREVDPELPGNRIQFASA